LTLGKVNIGGLPAEDFDHYEVLIVRGFVEAIELSFVIRFETPCVFSSFDEFPEPLHERGVPPLPQ
jgi:hypothetical protein